MAKERGKDLVRFGLWRCAGVARSAAWGGGRWGLFERTWQPAGHRQNACLARGQVGGLTDQVADLLAYGLAQRNLEGCISLSEGFGQVTQIMGLTKLIATVGQDCGHGRDETCLLVAEHGQDGPLQVL